MPIRITGLNSGLDTDAIVQELVSANRIKKESYEKKKTKLEWKQDTWKEMNTKIYGFYSKSLTNMRLQGNYLNKKSTEVSDTTKAKVTADSSVTNGTQTLEVKKLATAGYLTGGELDSAITGASTLDQLGITDGDELTITVNGQPETIQLKEDMTVSELVKEMNGAGINASFDAKNHRFFLGSTSTGASNDFTVTASNGALAKLGLDTSVVDPNNPKKNAVKVAASSAEIVLNGATFTSDTNEFSVNGLNITATGVTSGPMTITTSTDVDGIYDMIKGFLKEYNDLMSAMETAYNAEGSKGYEPLTDDQKSEMSDEEVEKWEKKIKDSLLRRDDTLSSIMSTMSSAMSKTIEIDGKKYGLSSFGIKTAGYFSRTENQSYAYHIDGDKEDSLVEGETDRLKKAIAEDPDSVATFFTELSKELYKNLDTKMKSTSLSSSYTVYNDKQMETEKKQYEESIRKWEEKLLELEDFYYQKFAAMEAALGELQSQTNSLGSLFGG